MPEDSKNFQLEVIQDIAPKVSLFIDKYMRKAEDCWQPCDYLPDLSLNDDFQEIKNLQQESAHLPNSILVVLIGNMITEEALPSYQTFFNLLEGVNEDRNVASANPWATWSRMWTAEENRHGDLLNKYLYLTGRVDMKAVEISIQRLIQNGIDPKSDGNLYEGMVYTSFQERATKISHVNTGKIALRSGNSTLSKICNLIAGEEATHEKAYKNFMLEIFKLDPSGAIQAFSNMMKKNIQMPAAFLDKGTSSHSYSNYSNIAQEIGVYTSKDYASILSHLLSFWNIDKLTELNEKGKLAQDYLCSLPERYLKLFSRTKSNYELKEIWLKNPSLIHI
jgi:acyl-[acyl-carrier-protein] desaturase